MHDVAARAKSPNRSVRVFEVAGTQYVRLAIPHAQLPDKLTAAERAVVMLILEGKTNAAIAKARGVALRTVANQVASILKKMHVGSRSALLAQLTAGTSDD